MSAYHRHQERNIRVGRLVEDWTRSGLLSPGQRDQMAPELQVDLRRTNLFLRLTLFVFGMLILQSGLGLGAIVIDITDEASAAALCTVAAMTCYALTESLVNRYRLYRFGVEEAAAVVAVGLTAAAAALFVSWSASGSRDGPVAAGLLAGAIAAFALFLRFGYLYAALASMVCVGALPFQLGDSEVVQRIVAIGLLGAIAVGAWSQRVEYGDDYPGDTYGLIEAAAWVGIYALMNLQIVTGIDTSSWFYWATYAGIWIVPLLGLSFSIRSRQRPLLDVSLLMVLATLMSNKAYVGAERYAWDPIVFGLLLMVTATGVRRWLSSGANGDRHGFTASRVLASDKSNVGVAGIASVAHPGIPASPPASAAAEPIDGGGRSGGAGGGGSF